MSPFREVRQQYFTIAGNMLSWQDHHLTGGLHKADRSSSGVTLVKPQAHRNIVSTAY